MIFEVAIIFNYIHFWLIFRNYLDKIYEMVGEWTRDMEAKYQATLISKEVERFKSESTESLSGRPPSRAGSKKTRTPSPNKKKGGSPTGKNKKGNLAKKNETVIHKKRKIIPSV
jgi:hypothetical protein